MLASRGDRLTIPFTVLPFYSPRISKRQCFFRTFTFCNSALFVFDQWLATPTTAISRRAPCPFSATTPTPDASQHCARQCPSQRDRPRRCHALMRSGFRCEWTVSGFHTTVFNRQWANASRRTMGTPSHLPFEAAPFIHPNSLFNMVFTIPVFARAETVKSVTQKTTFHGLEIIRRHKQKCCEMA